MAKLTAMEHEGDRIIQELVRRLNTSFILPFDREDAFQLAQKLATTLDYITGIIDRMILYKTGEPDDLVKEMVDVLCQALKLQEKVFNLLKSLEKNKKEILRCCEEINKLEFHEYLHFCYILLIRYVARKNIISSTNNTF